MDSFNILEAQISVLQRVVLDQEFDRTMEGARIAAHVGGVPLPDDLREAHTLRGEDGTIDYHAYLMEYYVCQTMAGLVKWLMSLTPAPVIVAATDETPLIFGG